MLLISCFDDFWLIECKLWISEWLLLKHVWIHFINVCLCLYIDGVWSGVAIYEVWMKNEKIEGFGENKLDDEFEVNWCYHSRFVVVLNAFWCLQTNVQVLGSNLGSRGSKLGILDENWGTQNLGSPVLSNSL